ncbi:Glycosyltransferase involved in cell wall bisynthesis [Xylanibacter ruminicola]|uniref:Glycosyltransferase involved in cell wall bisynthesis n=1 Tax=Xylanibacter ruminicola TaxID=839 RepID=A0A1H4DRG9_XYLRU|nr:glycosyltransferase family 4 protein [Xylanibacter ruminicola]SEA75020.1 Glycosyltransferase involved in cell wall bisynthesis [Xylanibacter ruminicola]
MWNKIKIIRATTVPMSLDAFCNGMLKELSQKYEVVALSSPGKEMEVVAEREGVRTIAVPMERHISVKHDLISLWRMIKVFRKERPAMVHSMTPKAGLLCMMAAWLTRVPVRVQTFTGLVFPTATGLKRRILMATDWLTCACATHIIPEGEGVKNDLLNNGITKKPLKVLGYGNVKGVDMEYYSLRDEVRNKVEEIGLRVESKFTFVFVGRIVKDKGMNELCKAFDKLSSMANVRLLLVGPYEDNLDPISPKSKEIIERNPAIESVGSKRGEELLAYYAAADCFVFPSYREGFPNTVLEAGAMGLPSIVTDINGSREIIVEGENGIIIPSHDANALFDAMLKMMRDKEAREKMAGNARQMIASRYEQGYVRKCLYDFYDEILADLK